MEVAKEFKDYNRIKVVLAELFFITNSIRQNENFVLLQKR